MNGQPERPRTFAYYGPLQLPIIVSTKIHPDEALQLYRFSVLGQKLPVDTRYPRFYGSKRRSMAWQAAARRIYVATFGSAEASYLVERLSCATGTIGNGVVF